MKTYISILRGINVGGHKKILMKDLVELYIGLGFQKVKTYIQSGNVLFQCIEEAGEKELISKIRNSIFQKYNFDAPVVIRNIEEIKQAINNNPFLKDPSMNRERMAVTFLADIPEPEKVLEINNFSYPPDKFEVVGREIYLYCPVSFAETKLSVTFFESKLQTIATTRNWNTVNKLAEIAADL